MSKTQSTSKLLEECADWLQQSIREWTETETQTRSDAAQVSLDQRLQAVRQCMTREVCLPVKTALHVELCSQECWNATFLLPWSAAQRTVKHGARQLAAYLFLISHHLFAPAEVTQTHFSHHLDDAEKCILMCLKVSKTLARDTAVEEATKVLAWATSIVSAARNLCKVKRNQYVLEVQFAQLHVLWKAQQYEQACHLADALAQGTQHSCTYREALLEFIYEAALTVTCKSNSKPLAENANDAAEATTADTLSKPQAAIQKLLLLSLEMQRSVEVRSLKQQTFLGMTALQLSCSLLDTAAYAEAVEAAATAYQHLHTVEPLVVQLKAESLRHGTAEAARLFRLLATQGNTITFAELCAIAANVVESDPVLEVEVSAVLQSRIAAASTVAGDGEKERTADCFRFLCFLLHLRSEWSVRELLRCLKDDKSFALPGTAFDRFFFCSLWHRGICETSDASTNSAASPVDETERPNDVAQTLAVRWDCLYLALTRFAELGSSEVERQSALLDLSQVAIAMTPQYPLVEARHTNVDEEGDQRQQQELESEQPVLERTWKLWDTVEEIQPALCVALLQAKAQLAFLLGKREDGLRSVADLWKCAEAADEAKVHSCAAVVNFLLDRSWFDAAGDVARDCLRCASALSPPCTLDFAKVCALACLARGEEESLLMEVGDLFVKHVCPVLWSSMADFADVATATWWTRILWYVSDRLLPLHPAHAVRLAQTAVQLHVDAFAHAAENQLDDEEESTKDGVQDALKGRVAGLLEAEFDLFADGQAVLSKAEVQQMHSLLNRLRGSSVSSTGADSGASPRDRVAVTLALINVEVGLRTLAEQSEDDSDQTASASVEALHLDALPNLSSIEVEDLEQVAAACHRSASTCATATAAAAARALLSCAAVRLQLAAAELQWRRHTRGDQTAPGPALCTTLSMLYSAYDMANESDSKAAVLNSLMQLLKDETDASFGESLCAVLQTHCIKAGPSSEPATRYAARLLETVVEFFAVEAWNASVQWNVLQRRDKVAQWRSWALTLSDILDATNASRVAITDLAEQMPLL